MAGRNFGSKRGLNCDVKVGERGVRKEEGSLLLKIY